MRGGRRLSSLISSVCPSKLGDSHHIRTPRVLGLHPIHDLLVSSTDTNFSKEHQGLSKLPIRMPWFVPNNSSTLHCIPLRFVSQKRLKTLPANFPTPILSPQSSILYFGGLGRGKTLKQWRLYCDRWHRKSWLQGPVLRSGLGVPPVLCRSPRVGGIVQTLRGTRAPRWVPPFVYWVPVLCAFA